MKLQDLWFQILYRQHTCVVKSKTFPRSLCTHIDNTLSVAKAIEPAPEEKNSRTLDDVLTALFWRHLTHCVILVTKSQWCLCVILTLFVYSVEYRAVSVSIWLLCVGIKNKSVLWFAKREIKSAPSWCEHPRPTTRSAPEMPGPNHQSALS